jgi:hypothetical protein
MKVYDPIKGDFLGPIIFPKEAICRKKNRKKIIFGNHGKCVLRCNIRGVMEAHIYDVIELNITGRLQLSLQNGLRVELGADLFVVSKDIYTYIHKSTEHHFIALLERQKYHPVKQPIRKFGEFRLATSAFLFLNPSSNSIDLLYVPGPRGIAFKDKNCATPLSLVQRGSIKSQFLEISVFFHHLDNDTVLENYQFHPIDGSLFHLTHSSNNTSNMKKYITSANIYSRVT